MKNISVYNSTKQYITGIAEKYGIPEHEVVDKLVHNFTEAELEAVFRPATDCAECPLRDEDCFECKSCSDAGGTEKTGTA